MPDKLDRHLRVWILVENLNSGMKYPLALELAERRDRASEIVQGDREVIILCLDPFSTGS